MPLALFSCRSSRLILDLVSISHQAIPPLSRRCLGGAMRRTRKGKRGTQGRCHDDFLARGESTPAHGPVDRQRHSTFQHARALVALHTAWTYSERTERTHQPCVISLFATRAWWASCLLPSLSFDLLLHPPCAGDRRADAILSVANCFPASLVLPCPPHAPPVLSPLPLPMSRASKRLRLDRTGM